MQWINWGFISKLLVNVLSGPFLAPPSRRYILYTSCGQQGAVRQQRHDYCCRLAQSASQPLVVAESSRALAAGRLSPWLIND